LEDDTDLLSPAPSLVGKRLPVPPEADLVALANGPELNERRLGREMWLTPSTKEIRAHCHSNGAMLLPNGEGCRRLLVFLRSRPQIWHVDRVMQSAYVAEGGGTVLHAIPSLYGWIESVSDVEGAPGWVRPAYATS